MHEYPFIGGPWDGDWKEVADGTQYLNVHEFVDVTAFADPCDVLLDRIRTYTRKAVAVADVGKRYVFVCDGIVEHEAFYRLNHMLLVRWIKEGQK